MPGSWDTQGIAIAWAKGEQDVDETRHRRRAGLTGGAVTALLAVAACAGHATGAEIPWWAVLAVAVSTAGLAGWTGARTGRRCGPRDEFPEPAEPLFGTHAIGVPHPEHLSSRAPRG
ncbi:predicted protein [Streptomyces viridochromogenes DSM 40736]|uniref:Predicted protein n=1 Tax=Streptomyces viridochromogenes (strain DSM 40736 / JCM 4977 / BCRC 1201 / Tue 494) TaxID=591159 RepID=D9X8S0_STRVT|nr:hypothetical protein [Streptomyces viridochromogenes]EFL36324.1 predicted protein [Streptomyces viridochromogenes DSM 40736]